MKYSMVVLWAYPHRQEELSTYRQFILGQFLTGVNIALNIKFHQATCKYFHGHQNLCFADICELAIPDVPTSDYQYTGIASTILSYPHLFSIITPIKTDHFEQSLHNHPNAELIHSVCQGLRSGFWPFANTEKPETLPQGSVMQLQGPPVLNEESLIFLRSYHDSEISLGWYSQSFGPELLPGMVTQPVFTIPKKGSTKLCLVNDHSMGLKSLNSLIPTEGGFVVLDNLSDLGANI